MKYDKSSLDPLAEAPRSGVTKSKRHRLAAVDGGSDDFGYQEGSSSLSRVFTMMLLVHVFLIGAVVIYNLIAKKPDTAIQEPQVAPNAMAVQRDTSSTAVVPRSQQPAEPSVTVDASVPTVEYIVRSGKNLQEISEETGTPVEVLKKLNQMDVNESLYVGRKLRILAPAGNATAAQSAQAAAAPSPAPAQESLPSAPMVTQAPAQNPTAASQATQLQEKAPAALPVKAPETQASTPASAPAPAPTVNTAANNAPAVKKDVPSPAAKAPAPEPKPKSVVEQPAQKRPEAPAAEKPKPVSEGRTYVVKSGDTFYGIARKHKVDMKELMKINGYTDASKLRIGAVLKLP